MGHARARPSQSHIARADVVTRARPGPAARREGIGIGPFAVDTAMIARLAPEQLETLLEKLLEAEASVRRIPLATIRRGGQLTAPDQGVDAALSWTRSPRPGGWLPRRTIYFQCKAQALSAPDLRREVRPGGVVRPIFAELAHKKGAYVVLTTGDLGAQAIKDRIAALRDSLVDVPGADAIALDILPADRIARWANQHLGVAMWLLEQSGRALAGWRRWGGWSPQSEQPYLLDEIARADLGGNSVSVADALAAIRSELSSHGVVRLIGISGMGKTRLAEAVFDLGAPGGAALPPALAAYADAGLDTARSPALVAEQLVNARVEAVLVIDNLDGRRHAELTDIVRRQGSRVALLSIDYDVEEQPEDSLLVRLKPNSAALLDALLQQRHPEFSPQARARIADFSDGNARVALAVARGGGDPARLNDRELLDRLFQTGRTEDKDVRPAAEAAALVTAFHVEDTFRHRAEHRVLAELAGMSPDHFWRQVRTMLDWGIAQQRGPQRAVKPDPIANRLAARLIARTRPEMLIAAFQDGPERLFKSFAKRLGPLGGVPEAKALAERLLAPGGWLADPGPSGSEQREAFQAVARAAPEAALRVLEAELGGPDAHARTASKQDRQELGLTLAGIAWDERLFSRAMRLLAQLALAEGEDAHQRPTRDLLFRRFQPFASDTSASEAVRYALIDEWLDSDDPRAQRLAVAVLGHMLGAPKLAAETTRAVETEAKTWGDVVAWMDRAAGKLIALAGGKGPVAAHARTQVATRLRLNGRDLLLLPPLRAAEAIAGSDYWDDGWQASTQALRRATMGAAGPDLVRRLTVLEDRLRPRTADALFAAFVLGKPWRHSSRRQASRMTYRLAFRLGRCLARQGCDLTGYMQAAVGDGGPNVLHFGKGLSIVASDREGLWLTAVEAYRRSNTATRSTSLLEGILLGADASAWAEARLEEAGADPDLAPAIVSLHLAGRIDAAAIDRLERALKSGVVKPYAFRLLAYGGSSEAVDAGDLARLLAALVSQPDGLAPALDILRMRFHADETASRPVAPELIRFGRQILADPRVYELNAEEAETDLDNIAKTVLINDPDPQVATDILRALSHASQRTWLDNDMELLGLARAVLRAHPRVVLDEVVGDAAPEGRTDAARLFFGGWRLDDDDAMEADILENPEMIADEIRAWLPENPQSRAERLAALVPYMARRDGGELEWSSLALLLVELAPNPVPVLERLERRFSTGSGSGHFHLRFERRRPLVAHYSGHGGPRIRRWAREALRRLEDSVRYWEEHDRRDTSRFE